MCYLYLPHRRQAGSHMDRADLEIIAIPVEAGLSWRRTAAMRPAQAAQDSCPHSYTCARCGSRLAGDAGDMVHGKGH
ncbi:hypothetical protein PspTeo4_06440 [Pseudomonas sp. Teo4]|nr:hypothetical protein [Pseudomonas sp. Teo4]